jgi:DNA-binding MarR family transcriptional regulator
MPDSEKPADPKKPADPALASRVCLALMRVGTRMAVGFDQKFTHFGLTQAQFRLLIAVWNLGGHEGATPSALADYLFLERATVSVMINKLLNEGLLTKHSGENRRSYKLTLNEKSGALMRAMGPEATSLADSTLEAFAPEELAQLETHLKALEARLRQDASAKS